MGEKRRLVSLLHLLLVFPCLFLSSLACSAEVAFAGIAYSGDAQSSAARFPYSRRFDASLGGGGINAMLRTMLQSVQPNGFTIVPKLDELKGRDQAIAVALVMTNETMSTEQIGGVYKLFVQLRGQALFFDFKSMTILRAYPFSFAYIDKLSAPPTDRVKDSDIGFVYLGKDSKPGILDRFKQALGYANLPSNVSKYLQVSNVAIGDEARPVFPPEYGNGSAETWVADTLGEAIASKMDIPILPYSKGYAIGNVMSMTVADGMVYSLKLPEPDYKFSINITKLKSVPFEVQAAGKSLIYATVASMKLEEPLSAHAYLDALFKNGEVKVVPASQVNTEDFPAYQDSMRGLFTKLLGVIAGDNNPWLKSATAATDIDKQVLATRELLKSCR